MGRREKEQETVELERGVRRRREQEKNKRCVSRRERQERVE